MDNVQKVYHSNNIPSSQTFWTYLYSLCDCYLCYILT
jgi:hypothetical protein